MNPAASRKLDNAGWQIEERDAKWAVELMPVHVPATSTEEPLHVYMNQENSGLDRKVPFQAQEHEVL